VPFLRQLWDDFKDFWKTQLFWALMLAVLATVWSMYRGTFSGSTEDVSLPYVGMFAVFIVGNISRTLFVRERSAVRKKRRAQHRAERRAYLESLKPPPAPPAPAPNLQFRRVFQDRVFVGHEITGRSYDAIMAEIGNELSDSRKVGTANKIRAHLTFLGEKDNVVDTICPAHWADQRTEIWIRAGEGACVVLTSCTGPWLTGLHGNVDMKLCKRVHLQIIDSEAAKLLDGPIVFEFGRNTDSWGNGFFCKKL
jgi:hypothetical protein